MQTSIGLGVWLGSQPTVRLGLRAKMTVAAVVLGANEATIRLMARRGQGEPLAHWHIFQLPFLLVWLVALSITRIYERRARMVRAHEERLASMVATESELVALKASLSEVEGEKQHLEEERRLFTRAIYSKHVRDSVGLPSGSKKQTRPDRGGDRGPSPLQQVQGDT